MVHHMSDRPATAFNGGNADDLLGAGIESDEAVWGGSGFDEPDPIAIIHGHAVGV